MNENQTFDGSGDKTLDALVVIMAIILFFGTAQVMSTHAPSMVNDIVGFNASYLFGVISAICVEWGALRLHFNPAARKNSVAKWVKWILLGVSALCQVYNAAIETGTMAQLSETLKIGFTYLVPNIPLLFIVLMFWIGSIGGQQKSILKRVQEKGVINMLPNPKKFWYGDGRNTEFSIDIEQEELTPAKPKSPNGHDKETVNPTSRRV